MSTMKRTRLARILQAAIATLESGKRKAHCFSAHVPGQGYVNDGTVVGEAEKDYRRQLVRAAQAEVDNMGYASTYAEPGYHDPENGVLFANWNVFPKDLERILETAGYEIEWSDEWSTCQGCNAAVRTSPDCWSWEPAYKIENECELYCLECATEDEDEDSAGA